MVGIHLAKSRLIVKVLFRTFFQTRSYTRAHAREFICACSSSHFGLMLALHSGQMLKWFGGASSVVAKASLVASQGVLFHTVTIERLGQVGAAFSGKPTRYILASRSKQHVGFANGEASAE